MQKASELKNLLSEITYDKRRLAVTVKDLFEVLYSSETMNNSLISLVHETVLNLSPAVKDVARLAADNNELRTKLGRYTGCTPMPDRFADSLNDARLEIAALYTETQDLRTQVSKLSWTNRTLMAAEPVRALVPYPSLATLVRQPRVPKAALKVAEDKPSEVQPNADLSEASPSPQPEVAKGLAPAQYHAPTAFRVPGAFDTEVNAERSISVETEVEKASTTTRPQAAEIAALAQTSIFQVADIRLSSPTKVVETSVSTQTEVTMVSASTQCEFLPTSFAQTVEATPVVAPLQSPVIAPTPEVPTKVAPVSPELLTVTSSRWTVGPTAPAVEAPQEDPVPAAAPAPIAVPTTPVVVDLQEESAPLVPNAPTAPMATTVPATAARTSTPTAPAVENQQHVVGPAVFAWNQGGISFDFDFQPKVSAPAAAAWTSIPTAPVVENLQHVAAPVGSTWNGGEIAFDFGFQPKVPAPAAPVVSTWNGSENSFNFDFQPKVSTRAAPARTLNAPAFPAVGQRQVAGFVISPWTTSSTISTVVAQQQQGPLATPLWTPGSTISPVVAQEQQIEDQGDNDWDLEYENEQMLDQEDVGHEMDGEVKMEVEEMEEVNEAMDDAAETPAVPTGSTTTAMATNPPSSYQDLQTRATRRVPGLRIARRRNRDRIISGGLPLQQPLMAFPLPAPSLPTSVAVPAPLPPAMAIDDSSDDDWFGPPPVRQRPPPVASGPKFMLPDVQWTVESFTLIFHECLADAVHELWEIERHSPFSVKIWVILEDHTHWDRAAVPEPTQESFGKMITKVFKDLYEGYAEYMNSEEGIQEVHQEVLNLIDINLAIAP
jgi:hypothetical protein